MAENSTTKKALKKLDTQLKCSLCFDTFKEPKLLPCFHVFCMSPCLEKLVTRDGQSLTCPTCQHIVPLSEKGVAGLQSDFQVDRLFEIRDAFDKALESTETQCGNCEDGKATGYCHDCGDFLCDKCQDAHKLLTITKSHQLITTEEFQSEATKLVPTNRTILHCSKHPNKKLKLYCETCQLLICSHCTIQFHHGHNYDLVADVFTEHKEEIVSGLKPVKEKLDKVHQLLTAFDTKAEEINNQRIRIEADIHKEIDQQHQLLDQRRVELVGELNMLTQQKLKSLATQRDEVEITQVKLTSCLEYAESGLETGTQGEVLAMKNPVLKRIEQISTEFDPDTIQPEAETDMKLIADGREQLQQACRSYLEIADGPHTANVIAETSCLKGDGLTVAEVDQTANLELQVRTEGGNSYSKEATVTAEITHCKSQTTVECEIVEKHEIYYRPRERGKHELRLTANRRQIRGSPFTVTVMPSPYTLGKPSRVIGDLQQPFRTTTNSKGHIILVELGHNGIAIYNSQYEQIGKFRSHGKGPAGVAVDSDDNIYLGDYTDHRIRKFSASGDFLSQVGTKGSRNLQFNAPSGIGYNKTNGKVYVCDERNHRVQVLNTDLTFHNNFGKQGIQKGEFQNPSGVSFDTVGNVYIADWNNHRIQVFNCVGKYLREFGTKGSRPGQLHCPADVAVSTTGVVYVAEMSGNRVSMFKTSGEFIQSFGEKGKGKGQFQSPVGVAIDDDGNIIVADGNRRIQIF